MELLDDQHTMSMACACLLNELRPINDHYQHMLTNSIHDKRMVKSFNFEIIVQEAKNEYNV